MPRNLELKARIGSISGGEGLARAAGAEHRGSVRQTDTYFHVRHGRMKLREQEGLPAELIVYEREETSAERKSLYQRIPVRDPDALREGLTAALGVLAVVRKERRLYVLRGARIHLDRVDSLGDFLEFEIPDPGDEDPAFLMRDLRLLFGVEEAAIEKHSYSDSILRQREKPGT